MKKVIAFIMTLALAISLCSVSAFAAEINTAGGSTSTNVTGTYQAGSAASTVYKVDITWGAMEFTYTDASEGVWNPATHAFDGSSVAQWAPDVTDGNKITVTNHSNAAVTATLSFSAGASYAGITGSFTETSGTANDGVLSLATAVGTTVANAPKAEAKLNLSGALASGTTDEVIGTVTVTLG